MENDELIKAIATEVMGWYYWSFAKPTFMPEKINFIGEYKEIDFNPITNADHWMMVVERMRELGWLPVISMNEKGEWNILLNKLIKSELPEADRLTFAGRKSKSIGRAICEAAIAAVRSK